MGVAALERSGDGSVLDVGVDRFGLALDLDPVLDGRRDAVREGDALGKRRVLAALDRGRAGTDGDVGELLLRVVERGAAEVALRRRLKLLPVALLGSIVDEAASAGREALLAVPEDARTPSSPTSTSSQPTPSYSKTEPLSPTAVASSPATAETSCSAVSSAKMPTSVQLSPPSSVS